MPSNRNISNDIKYNGPIKLVLGLDFDETISNFNTYNVATVLHKKLLSENPNPELRDTICNIVASVVLGNDLPSLIPESLLANLNIIETTLASCIKGIKNESNLKLLLELIAKTDEIEIAIVTKSEYPEIAAQIINVITDSLTLNNNEANKLKHMPILYGGIASEERNHQIIELEGRFHRMEPVYDEKNKPMTNNIGKNHFLKELNDIFTGGMLSKLQIILGDDSNDNIMKAKNNQNDLGNNMANKFKFDGYNITDFDGGYQIIWVIEDIDYIRNLQIIAEKAELTLDAFSNLEPLEVCYPNNKALGDSSEYYSEEESCNNNLLNNNSQNKDHQDLMGSQDT